MVAALGGIALAVALAPWFSPTANALSDLGVADRAAVATAFNGGLLIGGGAALAYAWALWAAARTLGARVVAAEFAVAALDPPAERLWVTVRSLVDPCAHLFVGV